MVTWRTVTTEVIEWDEHKAETNRDKHGVNFEDATEAFYDPNALVEQDRVVDGELRWQTLGMVGGALLLLVAHVDMEEDGDEVIRIISARRASRRERRRYEQSR